MKTVLFIGLQLTLYLIMCAFSPQKNLENKIYLDLFKKANTDLASPKIFSRVDSVLESIYSKTNRNLSVYEFVQQLDEKSLITAAKILVQARSYPSETWAQYVDRANAPFREQYLRYINAHENKQDFNEIRETKPGGAIAAIEDRIFKTLPWIWKFYLKNKYILRVKVLTKQEVPLGPPTTKKIPAYTCEVIEDMKGNYVGPKNNLECISNYVKGTMEVNKEYILLLYGRHQIGHEYQRDYLIRGLATDGEAFFPVENGYIYDMNNKLRTGQTRISVREYKKRIQDFLVDVVESSK